MNRAVRTPAFHTRVPDFNSQLWLLHLAFCEWQGLAMSEVTGFLPLIKETSNELTALSRPAPVRGKHWRSKPTDMTLHGNTHCYTVSFLNILYFKLSITILSFTHSLLFTTKDLNGKLTKFTWDDGNCLTLPLNSFHPPA